MHMNQTLSIDDVKTRHLHIIGAIIDRNTILAYGIDQFQHYRIINYLKNSID